INPSEKLMGFEVEDPTRPSTSAVPVGTQAPFDGNLVTPHPTNEPQTSFPANEPYQPPQPVVQKEVIYREASGGSFITNLFWQLFNCLGCALFIVSVAIIALVFWINF